MKAPLVLLAVVVAAVALNCKKSKINTVQALSPATAQSYLTGGGWAFTYQPWQTHPALFDSVSFLFQSQSSPNQFQDSIVAYYPGRLVITTTGTFIVTNTPNAPDTLITPFTPYTAAFTQLDTFLVKSLSANQMVLMLYSANYPAGYTPLQDTVTRK